MTLIDNSRFYLWFKWNNHSWWKVFDIPPLTKINGMVGSPGHWMSWNPGLGDPVDLISIYLTSVRVNFEIWKHNLILHPAEYLNWVAQLLWFDIWITKWTFTKFTEDVNLIFSALKLLSRSFSVFSISITTQSVYDIMDFADKQKFRRIFHTLRYFVPITRGQLKPYFSRGYAYLAIWR